MARYVIAVDFGGTHLRAALVNEQGQIVEQLKRETRAQLGPKSVMDRIGEAVQDMRRHRPQPDDQILGLGVIAPGPLDPFQGIVFEAPNLDGWEDVPLAAELGQRTALPTWLGNDANLAALAEHRYGAGRGLDDLIYLTVSTGIGGGVITAGRLLLGAGGLAGELGHVQLVPDGPLCNCGNRGCVEALASGPNIAREAVARLKRGHPSSLHSVSGELSAREVVQAAQGGDALALAVLARAGRFVGMALANVIHIFNPQRIIIGGGVSNAGDCLLDPIREGTEARLMEAYRGSYDIVVTPLGDNVGLLGAAALAFAKSEG